MAATLLIDDQQTFLDTLTSTFRVHQVPLEVAAKWEDGIAQFRAGLHELVIADYDLQQAKQGLMLLLEVKRMRPSARLILISGAITPTASNILDAERLVDAYLPKGPNLIDALLAEAEAAESRALSATDWKLAAGSHVDRTKIDLDALEELDRELNQQLGR
jgi:ActR/RegA family two-component response regulator